MKVHYMRSPTRSWCRHSSRPSRSALRLLTREEFMASAKDRQCSECLKAVQRDLQQTTPSSAQGPLYERGWD